MPAILGNAGDQDGEERDPKENCTHDYSFYNTPTALASNQINPPTNAVIIRSYTLPVLIAPSGAPVAAAPGAKTLLSGGLLQLIHIRFNLVKEPVAAFASRILRRLGAVFAVNVNMPVNMAAMRHGFPP
jgi:hypothetical protein